MKLLFLVLLSMCIVPSVNAKETKVAAPIYTVLAKDYKAIKQIKPPFHPRIKGAKEDYVALSVQDEDVLRVFFYHPSGLKIESFDVHNPSKRDFNGVPAQYSSGVNKLVILFADGTALDSYLPPDALPSNDPADTFYMRWRRVWENYYFVVTYQNKNLLFDVALMTEKSGHDLLPVLGETSVNARLPEDYHLKNLSEPELLYWRKGEKRPSLAMQLVPVQEKDLPSGFPKGLVRWIP